MKLLPVIVAGLILSAFTARASEVAKLSPEEAAKRVADGKAVLIDVREPSEWKETGVAAPAALLPMSDFNGEQKLWKPFLAQHPKQELILYCRSGHRAGVVGAKLAADGRPVANAGAFSAWKQAGLPVKAP